MDFSDMSAMFEQEEETPPYQVEYLYEIDNFDTDPGPFESTVFNGGDRKYRLVVNKDSGMIPYVDVRLTNIDPTISPHSINVSVIIKSSLADSDISKSITGSIVSKSPSINFNNMISYEKMVSTTGFIHDGKATFAVIINHSSDNSPSAKPLGNECREQTGYVGIQNQGATCYMNSMLQALYFLPAFQKIVFEIPTEDTENPRESIPLQLQRLFYDLHHSPNAVSTQHLTDAFGWDGAEAFQQHDVQEFLRVLQDNLESKLKGTSLETSISDLFCGTTNIFVRCVTVDFRSEHTNKFYDISLQVIGNNSLEDAIRSYLKTERLDGDNQYNTDEFGKQDADYGTEFARLPPVLTLHLNRFTYNIQAEQMVKVDTHFEYPAELDMGQFMPEPCEMMYDLVSVMIHHGNSSGGHYYSYARMGHEADWLSFNDVDVKHAEDEDVFQRNFGKDPEEEDEEEEPPVRKKSRFHRRLQQQRKKPKRIRDPVSRAAYLLIYVRRTDSEAIYHPDGEMIPAHLPIYFQQLEEEERARQQALAFVSLPVFTQADLTNVSYFAWPAECSTHVETELRLPISNVYPAVAKALAIDEPFTVFVCGFYGNPLRPIQRDSTENAQMMVSKNTVLYVHQGVLDKPLLVFIKEFKDQQLRLLGSACFDGEQNGYDLLKVAHDKFGVEGNVLYTEDYAGKSRELVTAHTVSRSNIAQGSIIVIGNKVFHPVVAPFGDKTCISEFLPEYDPAIFTNYMALTHASITIDLLDLNTRGTWSLALPTTVSLDTLKTVIAKHFSLDYDPAKNSIQFFLPDSPFPVKKFRTADGFKSSTTVQFEMRDIPEDEMAEMLTLIVQHGDGYNVLDQQTVIKPRGTTPADLADGEHLRYYSVWDNEVWEILKPNSPIRNDCCVRWEITPEDQRDGIVIRGTHEFSHEIIPPFFFRIIDGEKYEETEKRLARSLDITGKRIQICTKSNRCEIIKPSTILSERDDIKTCHLRIIHDMKLFSDSVNAQRKEKSFKIYN